FFFQAEDGIRDSSPSRGLGDVLRQMKRLFPTSLALLLVMSSLGHVLAAAFCPRALGRECCFAKTPSHMHSSSSSRENMAVHDMHMDGMSM
ncbi:MAG TPA: hypothetical protein DCK99_22290, partial [Blastocatellia bacterium]|nr:hypothetical protein [Blastocatellia bacterium]